MSLKSSSWKARVQLSQEYYQPYFRLLIGGNVNRSFLICSVEILDDECRRAASKTRDCPSEKFPFLANFLVIGDQVTGQKLEPAQPETDVRNSLENENYSLLVVWSYVANHYGLKNGTLVEIYAFQKAPILSKVVVNVVDEISARQVKKCFEEKFFPPSKLCAASFLLPVNENDVLWLSAKFCRKVRVAHCEPTRCGIVDCKTTILVFKAPSSVAWPTLDRRQFPLFLSLVSRTFLWLFRVYHSRIVNKTLFLPKPSVLKAAPLHSLCAVCTLEPSSCLYLNTYLLNFFGLEDNDFIVIKYKGCDRKIARKIVRCKLVKLCCDECKFRTVYGVNKALLTLDLYVDCHKPEALFIEARIPQNFIRLAEEVKIALISCPNYELDYDTKDILNGFFQTPRLLHVGQVFNVRKAQVKPENDAEKTLIYFKVVDGVCKKNRLNDKLLNSLLSSSFLVEQGYTTLYQVANINSTVPRHVPYESTDYLLFHKQLNLIGSLIRSTFDRHNRSSSVPILISGAPGSGKCRLTQLLAKMCYLHYFEVDCYGLWSEIAGTSEAKIKHAFLKASKFAPCIFHVRNLHILGKDAQSEEHDPRVISCFLSFLKKLPYISTTGSNNEKVKVDDSTIRDKDQSTENRNNAAPVILIASTCDYESLSQNVVQSFLYHFVVDTLNDQSRLSFFKSAIFSNTSSAKYNKLSIDLDRLVKMTTGFVLSDLNHLISLTENHALNRFSTQFCDGNLHKNKHLLAVLGYKVDQCDFDVALKEMRQEFSTSLGTPTIPEVQWEDVGGLSEVKKIITDTIQVALDHPKLFSGGLRRSGILLYGPPGCGKTLLAKAIATECRLNFLNVKGPELLNMYVGQSEKNVRDLFAKARECAPCVIFFDEIDALAPNRGRSGDSGGVMDRLVSQLLAEMDGVHSCSDVFVIGATNRPDLVDQSLLRPGRFDQSVFVGAAPDQMSRLGVLSAVTRRLPLAPNVDVRHLAELCPAGATGADFFWLAERAALNAATRLVEMYEGQAETKKGQKAIHVSDKFDRRKKPPIIDTPKAEVVQEDFLKALQSLKLSVTEHDMSTYKLRSKQTAL